MHARPLARRTRTVLSSSHTIHPSPALDANSPPVPNGSNTPPPSPLSEKSVHGFIHSLSQHQPEQQHQRKNSLGDDEHEDDGSSIDRVFSVTLASADDSSSLHSSKLGSAEKVYACQSSQTSNSSLAVEEKASWWVRIRDRNRTTDSQESFDEKRDLKLKGEYISESGGVEDDYPDGGFQAWMVVLGGMLNTFSTFGYVNSWGVFQSYYQQTILKDSSPSNIAWIGSIQYALGFLPALVVGRMFDLGYFRSILLASSLLLIMATFLVAECTVYWKFLLWQGFAIGLGSGGIFGPTMAVVSHWFKKRRGLAIGLVMMGSSLGGTLIPVTAKNLIGKVGFKWTMRLNGCFLLFTLGLSNLIMKRRLPPKNLPGGILNLSAFRSPAFTIYCISALTTYLGLYTVLTYIDVAAAGVPGVSEAFAFYLVSIANLSSLAGRYVSGMISDRVGSMNVMIPSTILAGVMTVIWPYARMLRVLVAIAIVYGFCSGAYIALFLNPLIEMGDMDDVGRRMGMFMSIVALGALAGPPISGAINKASGGYAAVGWYAGSMVLLGVVMMGAARWLVLRRWKWKF